MNEFDACRALGADRLTLTDDPLEVTQRLAILTRRQIACEARRLHEKYHLTAVLERPLYATDVGDFRDGQRSEYDRMFQDLRAGGDE